MVGRLAFAALALAVALAACDSAPAVTPAKATPSPAAESASGTPSVRSWGFLMRTDAGDTIAIEHVLSADKWLDVALHLPRRNERQRIVLTRPASRWDITRGRDHVRVFSADSLYVTNGDMIGVPVTMRGVAAPRGTRPWHDASAALLENIVRAWHNAASADSRTPVVALPWSEHIDQLTITALAPDSALARTSNGEWRLAIDATGHVLGGVAPARRLRIERFAWQPDSAGAASSTTSATTTATTTPSDAAYLAENITVIAHDGVALAGTFSRPPKTAHPTPAVLLISGAGPQDRNLSVPSLPNYRLFAALADTLTRRGFAVLRLDDRGTGRSGGVAYSATPADETRDARAAIDWLRRRSEVHADRIALVGHSDGGLTALDAAEGNDVSALVLLGAPARSGRELARAQRRVYVTDRAEKFSDVEREQLLAQLERDAERVARVDPWLDAWLAHDPSAREWTHDAPALLVHGLRDRQVDPEHASELSRLLRGKSSRIVVVHMEPDANHLLVRDTLGDPRRYASLRSHAPVKRVLGVITEWLDTQLHDAPDAQQGAQSGAARER